MARRIDQQGQFRTALEKNRKIIYATQTHCAICGGEVDFSLKFPHPMSATVDHIIPVSKGGHPSDLSNLQLAHLSCNRSKSDRTIKKQTEAQEAIISNRILPHSMDWAKYKGA